MPWITHTHTLIPVQVGYRPSEQRLGLGPVLEAGAIWSKNKITIAFIAQRGLEGKRERERGYEA